MGDIDKQIDALKYGHLKEANGINYYEFNDESGPFYRNDTESDYDTSFDKDSGSPSKTIQTVARHPVAWFSPVPTDGIYPGPEFTLKIKDEETVKLIALDTDQPKIFEKLAGKTMSDYLTGDNLQIIERILYPFNMDM